MNWTKEQHILAFNLYCRIPFGKVHKGNPKVIELAKLINRSPSAVGMKLGNFARLDPALQKRGVSGLSHGANGEEEIWHEFAETPEELAYESEKLHAELLGKSIEQVTEIETYDLPREGKDRETIVKVRVNQSFFRRRVLSAYDYKCCITGLSTQQLLVAGHIVPWAEDTTNRLNPKNGLCINMLHDKAFDRGLMWIDENFTIHYHDDFVEASSNPSEAYQWMKSYEGKQLMLPKNFKPSIALLAHHAKKFCA